jgi:hypothetical protein
VDRRNLGEITVRTDGSASVPIWSGRLSELATVMDPQIPFVVVEGHLALGMTQWSTAAVPLSSRSAERPRTWRARRLSFDLLLTPAELIETAEELGDAVHGGALLWQAGRCPPPTFSLEEKTGQARSTAAHGLDIRLVLDLPHAGETALLWALTPDLLHQAMHRLLA